MFTKSGSVLQRYIFENLFLNSFLLICVSLLRRTFFFQATSPAPCMSPCAETIHSQSEEDEITLAANELQTSTSVQDASNQTESLPVSDDENLTFQEEQQQQQQVVEKTESVDLSGLELLSNSIEQFESVRIQCEVSQIKTEMDDVVNDCVEGNESCEDVNDSVVKEEQESIEEVNQAEDKMEPNNVLNGLGLLCQLAHQRFIEEEEAAAESHSRPQTPTEFAGNCLVFYSVLYL